MKIKQKLIALFLFIGLLPTLVVSLVAYITISNELQDKTSDQLTSIAVKQQQKINSLLQGKQEEVSKLANRFDFQVALGEYLAAKKPADRKAIQDIFQAKQIEVPTIQAIYLTNTDGTVVVSTITGAEGQKIKSSDYTFTEDSNTAVTVQEDQRDGIDKLYITTNVSVNKKEAAIMNVVFRLDDIVAAVQDYTGLGTTGETVVAEEDGSNNAVSLFPLRFDTDAALQTKLNSLRLFANADNTYRTEQDYRGKEVVVASRSIGFANWMIATKMDKQEVMAPITQLRNALISIVIVSSVAIVLIALYFARFFTEPILRIARASQRIGQGDFSEHIDLQRSDEIGALGESINAMGVSLKDFVARIESQRNRLEVILNSAAESILAIDKQGSIIIANHAATELTSLAVEDIVGKDIHQLFTWQKESEVFTINYDTEGTKVYPNLRYVDSAGVTHFVRLIISRVSGEQEQKTAQTIVTIHDETKSRELEDMKVDFVSMAAHELRTPLAAIRGYLELIAYKSGQTIAPEISGYIHQAIKSSNELGGLINNLLDVTRIERGTLTLNMEAIDLAAATAQAVKDIQFSANDKHIALTYDGPATGLMVAADRIALREVINNLLANAIKYTAPNGAVVVSLESKDDSYALHVKDTGIGIPKQALPNLFTKFYRVHGGLDSGSTGTGLGLYISRSIAERHHGSIQVESEEGVGSIFTFTLPVLDERQLAAVQSEQQSRETLTRRHRGWVTKNTTR